ncbi:3412_t:CDS:2, partial [Entrophospora sp. SA101]
MNDKAIRPRLFIKLLLVNKQVVVTNQVLETPPEIVKMKIDYLVSFCDKSQNLWTIFLKNFGEYLRKTFPSEKLSVQVISYMTSAVWRMLDIIKIYFEILAKMAEENHTDNELTDEFTRNFFNGTSPNMSCLHQESDYGKELNNNNEIINIILTNSHIILFQ